MADNYQRDEHAHGNRRPESKRTAQSVARKVVSTEYIRDLRVGRSWVLPQLKQMGMDKNGHFSESHYYDQIEQLPCQKYWDIMLRNYHALSVMSSKDSKGYTERARWWSQEVAVAMAVADFEYMKECISEGDFTSNTCCRGGDFVYLSQLGDTQNRYERMFFLQDPPADFVNRFKDKNETVADLYAAFEKRIEAIRSAASPQELYGALLAYNRKRCRFQLFQAPDTFVNAYAGDGAYAAMMTKVKFLNFTLSGLNREQTLAEIENKVNEVNGDGKALMSYCASRFLQ